MNLFGSTLFGLAMLEVGVLELLSVKSNRGVVQMNPPHYSLFPQIIKKKYYLNWLFSW